MDQVISVVPRALHDSPLQYRSKLGDITELTASAREHGILEPIMVRPAPKHPGEHELVFGHRRKAAAIAAELPEILAVVKNLTDDEVIEIQVVENSQRSDPHPIDEADGFAELIRRGRTAQQIADRIGRAVAYVAQRLKLCGLSKPCRKALDEEQVTIGVALELAKLPTQKLQDDALALVSTSGKGAMLDGLLSVADARKIIEEDVMRALKGAPFDRGSASLVPKAGSCAACPKRTGAQAELFPDASSPDLCTDPHCFKAKVDASFQIRVKAHKAAGGEVMTQKNAKEYFGGYGNAAYELKQQFQPLDQKVYMSDGSGRTIKSLFGVSKPPTVLAMDPKKGVPVELVAKKDFEPLLRKANKESSAPGTSSASKLSAGEKRRKAEERRAAEIRRAVAAELGTAAEQFFTDELVEKPMAEVLVQAAAESMWSDTIRKVADRRKMPEPPKAKGNGMRSPGVERIKLWAKGQPANVLLSTLLELLVSRDERNDGVTSKKLALKLLGIDEKTIAGKVVADAKAGKGKPAKASGKKPKPGTCRECGCTEDNACVGAGGGACYWADATKTLCSECAKKLSAADAIGLPRELIAKPKKSGKAKAKAPAKKKAKR